MKLTQKSKTTKLLFLGGILASLTVLGFFVVQKFFSSEKSAIGNSSISETGVCSGDTRASDIVSSALDPNRTSDDGSFDRLVAEINKNSESSKDINCVYILLLHSSITGDFTKGKQYLSLYRELESSPGDNPYRPAKNYLSIAEIEKLLNTTPPERLAP